MHVFDADKLHGSIIVRRAENGETLACLNEKTVTMADNTLVIADEQGALSMAGLMGGEASAVSDGTRNIVLEAAWFAPAIIAGKARQYGFGSDSAFRFERGVDPEFTTEHIERITALVLEICGTPDTQVAAMDDQKPNMPQPKPVQLRVARAAKVIGMPLTQAQCVDALKRLGLPVSESDGVITVTPPSYRFDIAIEEDLIEEVARMVGYNNLPTTPPLAPITPKLPAEATRSPFAVRRLLAGLGYQETINFSFVEERWEHELAGNSNPIKLLNPIASQMSVMRSTLLGSLLQVLKFNLDRKAQRVRVFELGRVFLRDASVTNTDTTVEGCHQPMRVAGVAYGANDVLQWGRKEQGIDFFDVKGDVEAMLAPLRATFEPGTHPAMHPGRCARVLMNGKLIGHVGELHPQWRQSWELPQAPVLFELELDAVLQRTVPQFKAVAKHQAVERDLAIVVAERVTHSEVMAAVESAVPASLLRSAVLFDVYRPKAVRPGEESAAGGAVAAGEKSLAVRLTLGRDEASLTEAEIEAAVQAVVTQLVARTGGRLRV